MYCFNLQLLFFIVVNKISIYLYIYLQDGLYRLFAGQFLWLNFVLMPSLYFYVTDSV